MENLRYLSVCSGIEAATQAWHALGWEPAAVADIEPFPCAVLHHRLGAGRPMFMPDPDEATTFKDRRSRAAAIKAVTKIPEIGRIPNFGDLTQFERWPDAAIDVLVGGTPCQDYSVAGLRLGMAGSRGQPSLTYVEIAARYRPRWVVWENVPGVLSSNEGRDFARFLGDLSGQQIGVPAGGWKNAGIIPGIDAAYGLAYRVLDAQYVRTRRFGGAVPQRRRRVFVVGYLGDWRRAAAVLFDGQSLRGDPPTRREQGQRPAPTLAARARGGGGLGTDFDLDGGLISMAHGQAGAEICFDHGPTLSCNHEAPIVAHALRAEGFDASEDGTGRGTPIVPVRSYGLTTEQTPKFNEDCALTLTKQSPTGGGQPQAVAFAENSRAELRLCGGDGAVSSQLTTGGGKPGQGQPTIALPWAVRRLTPRECERLQGFPDDYTLVPVGNKLAADGPRYKALGNSMAVNVMEWIGQRIQTVEDLG